VEGNPWTSAAEINLLDANGNPLPQSTFSLAYVDSQETSCANYAATNAFDGDPSTFWHTEWCNALPGQPHEIQIDLGSSQTLTALSYLPRQDGCDHGWIKQYEIYTSADSTNWGSPVAAGSFDYSARRKCKRAKRGLGKGREARS